MPWVAFWPADCMLNASVLELISFLSLPPAALDYLIYIKLLLRYCAKALKIAFADAFHHSMYNFLHSIILLFFFFSFQPFPSVRGGHSVSSFSTSFCLQHPFPSHQLPAYLPLLHLKIFSLVSLFSSFPVTPFPSFFLPTYSWSLLHTSIILL